MSLGVSKTKVLLFAVGDDPEQAPSNATVDAAIEAVSDDLSGHTSATTGAHGMSAFGASLVDDANASAARATLGLGSAATSDTTAFDAAGSAAGVNSTLSTHVALATAHGISSFGSTLVDDTDAATARGTLGLGSAATRAAPASGNAASGEVVLGNDTRLTDSRTPTTHTHDDLYFTEAEIVAGYQPLDATTTALAAWDWSSGVEVPAFTADDTLSILRTGTGANNLLMLSASPGTPDGSKYLRDDLTWATPSGGSSQIAASISTDTTYNGSNGSWYDVTPLTISLPPGKYAIDFLLNNRTTTSGVSTQARLCIASGSISEGDGTAVGIFFPHGVASVPIVYTSATGILSGGTRSSDTVNVVFNGHLCIEVTSTVSLKIQMLTGTPTANVITTQATSFIKAVTL